LFQNSSAVVRTNPACCAHVGHKVGTTNEVDQDGESPPFATREPLKTTPETASETVSGRNSASPQASRPDSTPRLRQTPSFGRRLPRFRRAKHSWRPPLALQDRDLELLRTAHEYRLISTPQYLRLFSLESQDGIYTRLQKLFHHGYLDRLGENPNAPLVYALGRRGAEVLDVSRRKEVGDRYLAHQLMIGDFRIALTLAASPSGIEVSWRRFPDGQPVRPDGFFGLRFPFLPEGRNRAFFFLEADRSTMPRERFLAKLYAYQTWHAAGGHTAALGIKAFRVLTVTKSVERMRSLLMAAAGDEHLASRHAAYWFASLEDVPPGEPSSMLGLIWRTAAEPDGRATLVPAGA
jgi:protein involved in plasmid replication-relaxation